ncbi:MAG: DUF4297 domain-containing protein [Chloroflexi bacterium]|nr:DUF4297 domain-containing protein [Chloroflexota bacterium]
MKVAQSIRDLQPLNIGGTVARAGFEFQDHVAVWFCLEMLVNNCLKEVWCETQDDITLIWQDNGSVEWVEFVQVKIYRLTISGRSPNCANRRRVLKIRIKTVHPFLKILAQDRCRERCQFRVITSLNVNNDLEILTLPLSSHSFWRSKIGKIRLAYCRDRSKTPKY